MLHFQMAVRGDLQTKAQRCRKKKRRKRKTKRRKKRKRKKKRCEQKTSPDSQSPIVPITTLQLQSYRAAPGFRREAPEVVYGGAKGTGTGKVW